MNVPHDVELLLDSYSKRCPDCRLAVAAIDEPRALQLLADEVSRAISGDLSRIRLNNAITIWQQAARRADKHGGPPMNCPLYHASDPRVCEARRVLLDVLDGYATCLASSAKHRAEKRALIEAASAYRYAAVNKAQP